MRLDSKRLNLVIPVDRSDGSKVYVHSTPISREVFETYFEPLSKAFSRLITTMDYITGARVAAQMLRKVAQQAGEWDGEGGIEKGFWPEVRRLTVVMVPGAGGYETLPFDVAVQQGRIDSEDVSEIENALAFFISASFILRRNQQADIHGAVRLWGAQTTPLGSMEFIRSLPTSNGAASSGATAAASSPTSSTGLPAPVSASVLSATTGNGVPPMSSASA